MFRLVATGRSNPTHEGDKTHDRSNPPPIARFRRHRRAEDDPLEAFVETHGRAGRDRHVRHHGLGLHGRDGHLRARRHPPDPGGARAGRRPHGRRLCARVGPPRRRDRPERPRHQQLRDGHRGRLLGAQPGRDDHARDRHHGHGPRRLPGSQPAADVPGVHQVPGPREQPQAHGRVHRALLRPRHLRDGPDPAQHSARLLLRRDPLPRSRSRCAWSAARAARTA